MHVPGLLVVVPSTPADAKGLLKTAIRNDNPVIFLEHKLLYFAKGIVPAEEYTIPFGRAVTRRSGRHITVVATQMMLNYALQAADDLQSEGIELEVIDPRTLVPLDIEAVVASVRRTNRLLICHEAVERCGWAGEVAMGVMEYAFDYLDAPIARVCGANVPVPYSEPLEGQVIPGKEQIITRARELLEGADLNVYGEPVELGQLGAAPAPALSQ
jgi:pyruvate/2-oxoglutarate/acetoin dehydrogenase E1 component